MKKILVLIFILLIGAGAYFKLKNKKKVLIPKKTYIVKYMDLNETLDETGIIKVEDKYYVSISSPINEKVLKVFVKKGDYVKKGDLLATLDSYYVEKDIKSLKNKLEKVILEYKKNLKDLNLKLSDLNYQINFTKINLANKEKDFKYYAWLLSKYRYLYKNKKIISEEKYKNVKVTLDKIRNEINSLKEKIKKLEKEKEYLLAKLELTKKIFEKEKRDILIDLQEKKKKLENYNIISPIDGQIVNLNAKENTYPQNPLFEILSSKKLVNYVYVDEIDIGKIKKGQKVIFKVDAYPQRKYIGVVKDILIKPIIQNNVVFYLAKVTGFNKTGLLPEMTTHNEIILRTLKHVLVIPSQAVKWEHGKEIVYVLKGNTIEKRIIKTGVENNGYVQVLKGLKPGEKVVLSFEGNR